MGLGRESSPSFNNAALNQQCLENLECWNVLIGMVPQT
jgi:hypothetical protein